MPPDECRSEGTPSLGEVPYAWGKPFWVLLWRLTKGPRRKGETLSGRYRRNGYVHPQEIGRLSGRHREQARLLQWIGVHPQETGRLSGRLRRQANSHNLADSKKAPFGAFRFTAATLHQAISAVVSNSKVNSPSLRSMCTTPPCSASSPKRISSASGRLILS